ncbi:unnamed protein product [Symbiodinium microadriaticum]|nr:unnamed protein product [Symbiodinium microadriaticum]
MVLRSCQGSAGSFIRLVLGHVLYPVLKAQGIPPVRKAHGLEWGGVVWDSPLLPFSDVAKALDETKAGTSFTEVVICASDQPAVLSRVWLGASMLKSVLAVTVGKEQDQAADTQRRVPGRVGDSLVFRQATVVQLTSAQNGAAPRPAGMKQQAVKIVQKPTEVLVVRVSKTFASKELWESFEKAPQKCIVQWLAGITLQMVRLLKPEAEAVLKCIRPGRDLPGSKRSMQIKGRIEWVIEWVERLNKQGSHAAYHARAIKCAGDLGLIVKGNQLAARSTIKADDKVPKIWVFEHVPLMVDPEQGKSILEESFVDVTMMRVRGSKGGRTFFFEGAHATNADADLVPINLDTGDGIIIAWAKVALAAPRIEKLQQRQLPVTAVPVEAKQTLCSTTPVTMPTNSQSLGVSSKDLVRPRGRPLAVNGVLLQSKSRQGPPVVRTTEQDPPINVETTDASSSNVEKERKMVEAKIGLKHCVALLTTAGNDMLNNMTEEEATKTFNDSSHQCHFLVSKVWFIQKKFPNIKAKTQTHKNKMYACHVFNIFKTPDIKKYHLFTVTTEDKIEDLNEGLKKMMRKENNNHYNAQVKSIFAEIDNDLNFYQNKVGSMSSDRSDILYDAYNASQSSSDRVASSIASSLLPIVGELEKISEDAINAKRMLLKKMEAQYITEFSNGKKINNADFEKAMNDRYTFIDIEQEVMRRLAQSNGAEVPMTGWSKQQSILQNILINHYSVL